MPSPKSSQKCLRTLTLPASGLSHFPGALRDCFPRSCADAFALLENLHTRIPTPASFLRFITPAFLSSHTLSPSLTFSFSTFLFLSTIPPVTICISPLGSRRQQSLGTTLRVTRVDKGGRRDNERFKDTRASEKPSLRAATWVRVRYIEETGGCSACSRGRCRRNDDSAKDAARLRCACSRRSKATLRKW